MLQNFGATFVFRHILRHWILFPCGKKKLMYFEKVITSYLVIGKYLLCTFRFVSYGVANLVVLESCFRLS